ncbi:50S ribosomal protein L11 methyltransferase [Mesonia sp. K7]|uniref:50S ribosomal protein L11 methyltransferase n=1 Tax=Mesonia sp. K7 TaxID=2218606 RepID=UPI000DA7139A|nr:50S ribosomal protein L11 methyltransferase [Mesonia sp. K7]PZD78041.1 50S ribosomal protein L11 methyltransferase [Mesonia sp. K7]
MTPSYIGYFFTVNPPQPASEILMAELAEIDFESFVETETGLEAYVLEGLHNAEKVKGIQILNTDEFEISYESKIIEQVNWNEEWEKNFQPIEVNQECHVRAPFHPSKNVKYDIVIEPKMSFGTGHHATTHMMIEYILENQWQDKKVLDMGCGTGVLAILAAMKGAKPIDAIDIDNWCYLNTLENIERNRCQHITAVEGEKSLLKGRSYDVVIANINRNILWEDLPTYVKTLTEKGEVYLSGFYQEDLPIIREKCESLGLSYQSHKEKENWVAAKFVK